MAGRATGSLGAYFTGIYHWCWYCVSIRTPAGAHTGEFFHIYTIIFTSLAIMDRTLFRHHLHFPSVMVQVKCFITSGLNVIVNAGICYFSGEHLEGWKESLMLVIKRLT